MLHFPVTGGAVFFKRHYIVKVAEDFGKEVSESDSLNYYFDLLGQTIEDNEHKCDLASENQPYDILNPN